MKTANRTKPVKTIKLTTPADIVDAVPYLVGFQPADSVVGLSLRGPRCRLGLTARMDLPTPEAADECARELAGYLKNDGAGKALILLYPQGGRHDRVVEPLAGALRERFKAVGVEPAEMLCVGDGRWWSLQCRDDDCCPSSGTPVAVRGSSTVATALTVEGRVVFGSRSALAATIAPVQGFLGAAMFSAITAAKAAMQAQHAIGRGSQAAVETVELFRAAVQRRLDDPANADVVPGVDEAARLIVGLDDVSARDQLLTWYDDDWGEATRAVLTELVRRAVPPFGAPALTTLAWVCYLRGDGAMASIALEGATRADARYNLARLLVEPLTRGLNPKVFAGSMRELQGFAPTAHG